MSDVDAIIERILAQELERAAEPAQEEDPAIRLLTYRCNEHAYDILYDEANEKAVYKFDGKPGTMETPIILAQRNYYVDTGYWLRGLTPPQGA